jgi:Zn-dependent protease
MAPAMATLSGMFKSWRLGKLFGFPIEINLSFLILLGVAFFAFRGGAGVVGGLLSVLVICLAFGFVVLHELGHALVARQLGVHVTGIELGFLGGAAKMANLPRTPRHELLIAAAGPAVSLMLAGAGLGLGLALGSPFVATLGWINLVIAGFNLIPALPMDGGRILRALLVPRFGYVRATDLAVTVARVAAVGFVVLGLVAQLYMLLVLAPFLWLMGTRERMIARMTPDEGWYPGGVEVLDHDPWQDRGGAQRYTIVRRDGRIQIVPID